MPLPFNILKSSPTDGQTRKMPQNSPFLSLCCSLIRPPWQRSRLDDSSLRKLIAYRRSLRGTSAASFLLLLETRSAAIIYGTTIALDARTRSSPSQSIRRVKCPNTLIESSTPQLPHRGHSRSAINLWWRIPSTRKSWRALGCVAITHAKTPIIVHLKSIPAHTPSTPKATAHVPPEHAPPADLACRFRQ